MENVCTIHSFKFYTNDFGSTLHGVEKIRRTRIRLTDLKDFDLPIVEKTINRETKIVMHITSNTVWALFGPNRLTVRANFHYSGWLRYVNFCAAVWALHRSDRAVRVMFIIHQQSEEEIARLEVMNKKTVCCYEFLEFGKQSRVSRFQFKLVKSLKKHSGYMISESAVVKAMNKRFELKVPDAVIAQLDYFSHMKLKLKLTFDFKNDKYDKVSVGTFDQKNLRSNQLGKEWQRIEEDNNLDVRSRIRFYLTMLASALSYQLEIHLSETDSQMIFYITQISLQFDSPLFGFLSAITFLTKEKEEPIMSSRAKGALSLIPFVGGALSIKDSINDFKSGNPKLGTWNLVLGCGSLALDAVMVAVPVTKLVQATTSSAKVAATCTRLLTHSGKVEIACSVVKAVIPGVTPGKHVTQSSTNIRQMSDIDLLAQVFPRLRAYNN